MSSRAKTTSAAPRSSTSAEASDATPRNDRHTMVDRQGFAVGCDETPIFYRVRGPVDAPAVAFCDGIGCDGYVWKYLEAELASTHRIVHWHYRGHGRTPMPRDARRVDITDLADDLAAVLDAAVGDGTSAILAGHSMGVQVCLEAYRRHRERVAGLILLCGAYGTPLRTFKGKRTLEQVLPFVRFAVNRIPGIAQSLVARLIPTELAYQIATRFEINGELIRRDDFFPYLEHMARVDVRLFLEMLAAAGRHTARELLHTIAVPTLIVSGDRDGFTPAELSDEMHKLIRDSELHVVAGGSHTAPIERPAEVTAKIADFLRKRF
ncbi:MAG: alpha/beta hydrolase fold protein [Myxococcales bacterium]|nr:alpha/beta hydrolase fold protein [Myxococcales bacterium]